MKKITLALTLMGTFLLMNSTLKAEVFMVSSQSEFDNALINATETDTIMWNSGTYQDIHMDIDEDNLVIMAEVVGETIFTGASKATVDGSQIVLSGFQFLNGDIGTENVITSRGNNNVFEHLNIERYISYKYLIINDECRYNTVAHCNFENRINRADQNILSILVDNDEPGYHLVQYCSFKDFAGSGGDQGVEPIRIGVSTQAEFVSRSTVEYCYFTQCNGDGEIISNKAAQNVFRYNTFDDNPVGELVLRHGDEAVVYGNFFINSMGGIRIREGQKHVIFNNYFTGLISRSFIIQSGGDDPVDEVLIAYNTFVDSKEVRLSSSGSDPTNITLANNIFTQPIDNLIQDVSGTETWLGNIYNGSLGIDETDGLTNLDPALEMNNEGYYGLTANSPAIDASETGFPPLPQYEGLDTDHDILLDLMQQSRPLDISLKDLGCSEFPINTTIQPMATEINTGPSYLQNIDNPLALSVMTTGLGSVSLDPPGGLYDAGTTVTVTALPGSDYEFESWTDDLTGTSNPQTLVIDDNKVITASFKRSEVTSVTEGMEKELYLFPNPVSDQINLRINNQESGWAKVDIVDASGKVVRNLFHQTIPAANTTLNEDVSDLHSGMYFLLISRQKGHGKTLMKFIKK